MLMRLGNVVFWICCGLTLLLGVLALGDFFSHDPGHHDDWPLHAILAGIAYGIGAAVRYILNPSKLA